MKSRRRRGGPEPRSTWHLDPGAPARILWRRVLCSTPITPKTSDPGKFTDPELFSRSQRQRKDPGRRNPGQEKGETQVLQRIGSGNTAREQSVAARSARPCKAGRCKTTRSRTGQAEGA